MRDKLFRVLSLLMFIFGIIFFVFSLSHPEYNSPFPNSATYLIYFLYIVFIFIFTNLGFGSFYNKIFRILDILQGSFLGFTIGNILYERYLFFENPSSYEIFSMPWFLSGRIISAFLLFILVSIISLSIKWILYSCQFCKKNMMKNRIKG